MGRHQAVAAEQIARRRRVNDRRVLNGIFWVLRSGAPWRDPPVAMAHAKQLTDSTRGHIYG
jgi:transposase